MSYDPMAKIAAERERDRRAECFDDLLAACEEVERAQRGGDYAKAFDMVRAAIAKAEGK